MEILNLSGLLPLADGLPEYHRLVQELKEAKDSPAVTVVDNARAFLIATLSRSLRRSVVVLTPHPENARKLYEQLNIWSHPEQVRLLPEPDALPYERITPDSLTELERLRVLVSLQAASQDKTASLIVASAHALVMKQPSHATFIGGFYSIQEGTNIEPLALMKRWQSLGYQTESIVEIPGTMGRRGGIIDIYPPGSEFPTRLEFFGNTIESIRLYDPANQRSLEKVKSVMIAPATDLLISSPGTTAATIINNLDFSNCTEATKQRFIHDIEALFRGQKISDREYYTHLFNQDSFLSFLPDNALLVVDEPLLVRQAIEDLDQKAQELRAGLQEQGELPVNFPSPYFNLAEIDPLMQKQNRLLVTTLGITSDEAGHQLPLVAPSNYSGQLPAFITRVKQLRQAGERVIIVSHQANRLTELLEEADIIAPPLTEMKQVPAAGSVTLFQGLVDGGWSLREDTHLFTDAEIFGFTKQMRFLKKRPVARHKLFADIKPGDYVVHIEHGIGEFVNFTVLKTNGIEKEYLVIKYAAGDRLYVPTDQVDRVNRYVGAGEQKPTLSRLGTQEWTRTKQRVKEATEEIARDLLNLYASREVITRQPFSKDTIWQRELEASFPYVETPDQVTVQQEIKEDMEKPRPMDRLVCGDVGYGKTEVGLRAAFKAVMDGKQVAVLVPTTVLAQQHYVTFNERMKAFPVRVEVLSRFRSPKEQKEVVEGLANGAVDICIGTHRLIQKDVKFKDLGLLIIDEEQRFGVVHKEYIKKIKQEVAVLTLSATPIPRTLHMSLVGVRDMSTMETPPEDRLPIKTYVAEYDERLIREAILREMERNGQVFFVHNRVQSIEIVADKLRRLVPEARVVVGHGQMPEGELERVTAEFIKGNADILVCTTIIESGLDMPNVNTLLVNQSDRLGLTQLYQLRGRVGRGATLAYAYFLFDKGKRLTPVAEKRLRTIYEATELGAGFNIAMKDLEIRGAGNLLGVKQSGHISAVGFHLYSQLLAAAIETLKTKPSGTPASTAVQKLPPPSIDLPLSALIPEDYVSDTITRLSLYQRLLDMTGPEQIEPFVQELNDRFGPPPVEVNNLLYIVRTRSQASQAGIEAIATENGDIVLRLFEGMRFEAKKLASVHRYSIQVGTSQLRFAREQPGRGWQKVLAEILATLAVNMKTK